MMRKKPIDVIFVVDKSEKAFPFAEILNTTMKRMFFSLKQSEEFAGFDVYFTLVSFDCDVYENIGFVKIDSVDMNALELKYEGGTNPAPALEYALQKSIKRYETCVANGTPTYNPLIFFFTGDSYSTEKVCSDQLKGVVDKYWFYDTLLTFVSCGDEINVEVLDYHSVSIRKLISVNKNDVAKLTGIISEVLWFYQSQSSFEHTDEKYLASFFSKYKF